MFYTNSLLQEKLKAGGLAPESSTSGWCGWRECKNKRGMDGSTTYLEREKEKMGDGYHSRCIVTI